jgi:serine/threonine-protein kinase Chk1
MMCVNPSKRITIEGIKKHKWFTRKNPLLINGQVPDAISLAERLLQGLIVSGDLDFNLHSDGQRATVPESISLTQPEMFGPGLDLNLNRLPPSSALPAFRTTDPRKIALSQQISARRGNVPSASLDGRGVAAGAAASQFTQAMNHMVSWCWGNMSFALSLADSSVVTHLLTRLNGRLWQAEAHVSHLT